MSCDDGRRDAGVAKVVYRPEIDGLRAIAVLSVLIYHLDLTVAGSKLLRGGFLGVDVFFVISGFLIFSLVRHELDQTGQFSLLQFYERRARRLLPALLVVLVATLAAAGYILVPSELNELGWSALASIGFVSNAFWYFDSQEYGVASGLIKPLLHTWSLAVEEQFYLVFPLIYVALLRWNSVVTLVIGLAVILFGFLGAAYLTHTSPSFSFYMIASRVWELLAGGILGHILLRDPTFGSSFALRRVMPILGLGLILASLVFVKLDWNHPGLGTLGAVCGALLIICFADPKDAVTRLLSSRPFIAVGLISYSLYLWHYPIYAFGRRLALLDPGYADYALWLVSSFAAATASYFLIERPFRGKVAVTTRVLIVSLGGLALAVSMVSILQIVRPSVMPGQNGLYALYDGIEPDNEQLQLASWGPVRKFEPLGAPTVSGAATASEAEINELWFKLDRPSVKIVLVGNSHSKDMYNALTAFTEYQPDFQVARFGMQLHQAAPDFSSLVASQNFAAADVIAVATSYRWRDLDVLPSFVHVVRAAGKTPAIMSQSPSFAGNRTFTLVDQQVRTHAPRSQEALNRLAWEMRSSGSDERNERLEALAADLNVPFLRKSDFICDEKKRECTALTPDGKKALFDSAHYSLAGAAHFGQRIAEIDWLAPLRTTVSP